VKKTTILTISDNPMMPSGVGKQTRYFIESLLKTGRYKVISLGGGMNNVKKEQIKTEEYGDDWIIYPVDMYGNQDLVHYFVNEHKPDMIWFMTDPRFFEWLWDMDNEIRRNVPMVYYNIWDNKPAPVYNRGKYLSTDVLITISKLTDDVVREVVPEAEVHHMTHTVDNDVFAPLDLSEVKRIRDEIIPQADGKKIFFFMGRNAKRKLTGSLVWWFGNFLKKHGKDSAYLIMHTAPVDPNGFDLNAIAEGAGLTDENFVFSTSKLTDEKMAELYNIVDCTVNISNAEGFGLALSESLSCGTPVICTKTGGMTDQAMDIETGEEFGVVIEAASQTINGGVNQAPYIFEDNISEEQLHDAMLKIINASDTDLRKVGLRGRQHLLDNMNHKEYQTKWVDLMDDIVERYGSWPNKKYKSWSIKEI